MLKLILSFFKKRKYEFLEEYVMEGKLYIALSKSNVSLVEPPKNSGYTRIKLNRFHIDKTPTGYENSASIEFEESCLDFGNIKSMVLISDDEEILEVGVFDESKYVDKATTVLFCAGGLEIHGHGRKKDFASYMWDCLAQKNVGAYYAHKKFINKHFFK